MDMKKLIESLEECGMSEMPPAPMDKGQPVSMNVSLNASGKEHVEDLINMMKNAGLKQAEPVTPDMLSPRMDMERLLGITKDNPMLPGKDDIDGDRDLDASTEVLPSDGGPDGGGEEPEYTTKNGTNFKNGKPIGPVTDPDGGSATTTPETPVDDPAIPGKDDVEGDEDLAAGYDSDAAYADQFPVTGGKGLKGVLDKVGIKAPKVSTPDPMRDKSSTKPDSWEPHPGIQGAKEGYDNEPEPEYQDHKYMTKDLSGGLNREKKAYKKAQDGDNAMAVEAIKAQLMAALQEKKAKPDYIDIDGDGDTKEPMKKAAKEKSSKPKKGEVPPQFKK